MKYNTLVKWFDRDLILLLFGWVLLTFIYCQLEKYQVTQIYSGVLLFLTQSGCDIFILLMALKLWKISTGKFKYVYVLLIIAFAIEAFVDGNLNLTIYILNHFPLTRLEEASIEWPFFLFQLLQICFWISVFKASQNQLKRWFIQLLLTPFIIICGAVLYFLIFVYSWGIDAFSLSASYQIIAVILNLINFAIITLCLGASNNQSILCMSIGSLTLVTIDLVERFSILNKTYLAFTDFQTVWFFGLLLIAYGLFKLYNEKINNNYKNWLYPTKSLQAQCTFWSFSICMCSLAILLMIIYTFFHNEILFRDDEISKYLPSFLVIYSIATILASNLFSRNILIPFKNISFLVHKIMNQRSEVELNSYNKNFSSIIEFAELEDCLLKAFKTSNDKYIVEKELSETAIQVAHDIRSPLAVLDMLAKDLTGIAEDRRNKIRNAARRINDICNNLLLQHNIKISNTKCNEPIQIKPEYITSILEYIVSEKRIQYSNKNITFDLMIDDNAHNVFVKLKISEFSRVISNLINNSVEAISKDGQVLVKLTKNMENIKIIIKDNGCGIPSSLLPQIIHEGVSFGKKDGHGLGVSYAVKSIESWGGEYNIKSECNKGTEFEIYIPSSEPAKWFLSNIVISEDSTIIILDDDQTIHDIWNTRLKNLFHDINMIKVINCKNYQYFAEYYNLNHSEKNIYLIDFELSGEQMNGIDIIEKFKISQFSTLATNRFEDYEVRKSCEKINIKIIPKSFATHIPINIVYRDPDIILIDDDSLLTDAWKIKGDMFGKKVTTFTNIQDFMSVSHIYKKNIPIYIDSNLGNGIKGEEVSKNLFMNGFTDLYLSTGFNSNNFEGLFWIKEIVGKEVPF